MERELLYKLKVFLEKEEDKSKGILFSEYYIDWLNYHKFKIDENTYDSYLTIANKHILPYFEDKNFTIDNIKSCDLQQYYEFKIKSGLSVNTVRDHHANIHTCLKHAKNKNLIICNPAADIVFPRYPKFKGDFYSLNEIDKCLNAFVNNELEFCVWFAIFFGLRRSEILGLKWYNISFDDSLFIIRKTVVVSYDSKNKKTKIIEKNKTKNSSSFRTIPLTDFMKNKLYALWIRQGKPYGSEYVIKKANGELMKPDYLTRNFKRSLEGMGLRPIRFHDLRHSCATMLRRMGYDIQDVQKWLGHSNVVTTATFYAHYDISDKMKVSTGLNNAFDL